MERSLIARIAGGVAVAALPAAVCACSEEEAEKLQGSVVRVPKHEPGGSLEPGDEVPAFEAIAHTGQLVHLEHYRGRPLVLCFCTSIRKPDCRRRVDAIRADWPRLRKAEAGVLGVFRDDGAWLRAIAYDLKLPYLVLSDPNSRLARAFGLTGPGGAYPKPVAFVSDQEGRIVEVVSEVEPERMMKRILSALPSLDS
jgi:peroxiredoxin Q/BCP